MLNFLKVIYESVKCLKKLMKSCKWNYLSQIRYVSNKNLSARDILPFEIVSQFLNVFFYWWLNGDFQNLIVHLKQILQAWGQMLFYKPDWGATSFWQTKTSKCGFPKPNFPIFVFFPIFIFSLFYNFWDQDQGSNNRVIIYELFYQYFLLLHLPVIFL